MSDSPQWWPEDRPLYERLHAALIAEGLDAIDAVSALKAVMPLVLEHARSEYEGGIEYGTSQYEDR